MLHLLYALALLLLLCGACAMLAERFTLSPALLPLPVLSGAVVVLYLCGIAGFLRAGAVAVLLALAAVWVVGRCARLRPAGWPRPGKDALPPRLSRCFWAVLRLSGCCSVVQQPMFTQWDEFTAWGLAPKMVVERGAFYVADPVNLKASFHLPGHEPDHVLVPALRPVGRVGLPGRALTRWRWPVWPQLRPCRGSAGRAACLCSRRGSCCRSSSRPRLRAATQPQYVNAMADLPLAMLFGGTLCLYFAVGRRRVRLLA